MEIVLSGGMRADDTENIDDMTRILLGRRTRLSSPHDNSIFAKNSCGEIDMIFLAS